MVTRVPRRVSVAAGALLAFLAIDTVAVADDYARRAPFNALRWRDDKPQVRIGEKWYGVEAIDGTPCEDILAHARTAHRGKWQRRFGEDLVQLLSEMGRPPGATVSLDLIDLSSGEKVHIDAAPMTAENRRAILNARRGNRERARPADGWDERLKAKDVQGDLDALRAALEERYSYLKLAESRGYDWRAALDEIAAAHRRGCSRRDFAIALAKFIARFGDGHTRVRGKYDFLPHGFLPFVIEDANGRLVALKPDRSGLLDAAHPYVAAIDGVKADQWLAAASVLVATGSPQLVRHGSIELSHWAAFVRAELGREATGPLSVELVSESGDDRRTLTLEMSGNPPTLWPPARPLASHALADGFVCVRIPEMSSDRRFLRELTKLLDAAQQAPGLVIDVRGNPGGSREVLRMLYPRFCPPDLPQRVVNVAAYPLRPGEERDKPDGYLSNRSLYPRAWPGWSEAERAAIDDFARSFKPQWQPPQSDYSDWHYMVLGPDPSAAGKAYTGPVAVLMDEGCFSAADIFLAAMRTLPNVTLIGRPSGGGSGRAGQVTLPASRLRVMLSSMASFRPDGRLYDGRGVEPHVVVPRTLSDVLGQGDTMMDEAVRILREKRPGKSGE